jgi:hypothetical protein
MTAFLDAGFEVDFPWMFVDRCSPPATVHWPIARRPPAPRRRRTIIQAWMPSRSSGLSTCPGGRLAEADRDHAEATERYERAWRVFAEIRMGHARRHGRGSLGRCLPTKVRSPPPWRISSQPTAATTLGLAAMIVGSTRSLGSPL